MLVRGTVAEFDVARGEGWVLLESGERLYFHCVEIADGSRNIEVGTSVTATRRPGLLGVDELASVYSLAG